jgi:predicted permease
LHRLIDMHPWKIALRTLIRRPGYAITAILMLILGIGATTTLFSIVDTILLKPLPYPDPARLVTVMEASPIQGSPRSLIAPARLEDWSRMNQTFTAIAGVYTENVTDTSGPEPERLASRRASPRSFEVYGTAPLLGRTFTAQEESSGGPMAAVISYGLWTRRYGQSPKAVGQRLVIRGQGCTIVGVMPKDFAPPSVDLWIPTQFHPSMMRIREARFLAGIGRLKPGVTIQQAQADLARVERQLGDQFPRTDKNWSALVSDLKESRVGDSRRTLLLVFAAIGLLMLIAIANISGLMLAQLHRRQREMAIRSSMGATRAQVITAVVREAVLIGLAGAAGGGAIAAWGIRIAAHTFSDLPRMTELHFDWRALTFAAALSLAAAAFFGIVPAFQSTRADLAALLAESSRAISGSRRGLHRGLVIAQLALTVVLLSATGLLLRSYYNLSHVDRGFATSNTITFHVGAAGEEDRPMIGRLQMRVLEELRRLPAVETAGFGSQLPASGATPRTQVQVEGLADTLENASFTIAGRTISVGYLESLKVPLLAGEWCPSLRPFESNGANKSLVNRRFVEMYGKGQNMIGRRTWYPLSTIPNPPKNEIVGIVGDMREDGLAAAPAPFVYDCASAGSWPDPEYVVRARGDAQVLMREIPQIVHSIDPNRAVFGMKLLDAVIEDALEQPRLNTRFLATFAGAAMLLASVGLYSLISLMVTSRTREIGVRIALGAGRAQIRGLILLGAGRLLAIGAALGFALTLASERLIRSVLFGASTIDAVAMLGAVAVLGCVSILAVLLPARRATRIDPLEAIRTE